MEHVFHFVIDVRSITLVLLRHRTVCGEADAGSRLTPACMRGTVQYVQCMEAIHALYTEYLSTHRRRGSMGAHGIPHVEWRV